MISTNRCRLLSFAALLALPICSAAQIGRASSSHNARPSIGYGAVEPGEGPAHPALRLAALHRPEQSGELAKGKPAPNFTAMDANKKQMKLADYRGKVVIVDFWASWCGPCMASMPHNQSVMHKLKGKGLPVVLLAVDDGEPFGDFGAWVKKNGPKLSALTFVHSPPEKGVSGKLFGVSGIPTQFVLDKRGIVRASFVGYGGPTNDLENAVKSALAK